MVTPKKYGSLRRSCKSQSTLRIPTTTAERLGKKSARSLDPLSCGENPRAKGCMPVEEIRFAVPLLCIYIYIYLPSLCIISSKMFQADLAIYVTGETASSLISATVTKGFARQIEDSSSPLGMTSRRRPRLTLNCRAICW